MTTEDDATSLDAARERLAWSMVRADPGLSVALDDGAGGYRVVPAAELLSDAFAADAVAAAQADALLEYAESLA